MVFNSIRETPSEKSSSSFLRESPSIDQPAAKWYLMKTLYGSKRRRFFFSFFFLLDKANRRRDVFRPYTENRVFLAPLKKETSVFLITRLKCFGGIKGGNAHLKWRWARQKPEEDHLKRKKDPRRRSKMCMFVSQRNGSVDFKSQSNQSGLRLASGLLRKSCAFVEMTKWLKWVIINRCPVGRFMNCLLCCCCCQRIKLLSHFFPFVITLLKSSRRKFVNDLEGGKKSNFPKV